MIWYRKRNRIIMATAITDHLLDRDRRRRIHQQ